MELGGGSTKSGRHKFIIPKSLAMSNGATSGFGLASALERRLAGSDEKVVGAVGDV